MVAAIDPDIAEAALQLLGVDYEVLPASTDPERAMAPGAPPVVNICAAPTTEAAQGVGTSVEGVPALVERLSSVAEKAEALEVGDRVVVFALRSAIVDVEKLLMPEG